MTAMDPKYYVENAGSECPNCRGTSVSGEAPSVVIIDGEVERHCTCSDCGAEWDETFKITGYTDLEVPEGKEE